MDPRSRGRSDHHFVLVLAVSFPTIHPRILHFVCVIDAEWCSLAGSVEVDSLKGLSPCMSLLHSHGVLHVCIPCITV